MTDLRAAYVAAVHADDRAWQQLDRARNNAWLARTSVKAAAAAIVAEQRAWLRREETLQALNEAWEQLEEAEK